MFKDCVPVEHEQIDVSHGVLLIPFQLQVGKGGWLAGLGAQINGLICTDADPGFKSLQKVCDLWTRSRAGGGQGCPTALSKADSR